MATPINQLNAVSTVKSGQQIAVYDPDNGDTRKASITQVEDYMQSNLDFSDTNAQQQFVTQIEAVVAGFSVQVNNNSNNTFLILTGTGTLATGTIILPAQSVLTDGQEILISSIPAVTTLTVDNNGSLTIIGEPSALAAESFFRMRYDVTTNIWYRVG